MAEVPPEVRPMRQRDDVVEVSAGRGFRLYRWDFAFQSLPQVTSSLTRLTSLAPGFFNRASPTNRQVPEE
jgi:hypothetical protein